MSVKDLKRASNKEGKMSNTTKAIIKYTYCMWRELGLLPGDYLIFLSMMCMSLIEYSHALIRINVIIPPREYARLGNNMPYKEYLATSDKRIGDEKTMQWMSDMYDLMVRMIESQKQYLKNGKKLKEEEVVYPIIKYATSMMSKYEYETPLLEKDDMIKELCSDYEELYKKESGGSDEKGEDNSASPLTVA